jgi:hypothetical protein
MLANAQDVEQAAAKSDPVVLVILGLTVLLGLFIWLAGLGIRKVLFPVIGILIGGTIGHLITGIFLFALLLAAAGLVIAIILTKKITAQSVKGQLLWAFIFSVCGAIIVFAGMILLLIYKGAEPIKAISYRPTFYICLFAAMTLFGTIVQSLFCKRLKKRLQNRQNADNN